MLRNIKSGIKRLFNTCGLDIKRANPFVMYEWVKGKNIRTIIDVGANIGQFASYINKLLPEANLYSFEPLRDCYKQLLKKMEHVANFRAFQFALGAENGKAQIYHTR